MKLGLISDTHGFLDPRVLRLFQGVDHILHAGDIGPAAIIHALESLAPVTAVLGNNDWDLDGLFRETESPELGGLRFLLHHIVQPHSPNETLRRRIAAVHPQVVVFGHTHRSSVETVDGLLFINPGYAGKPRFNQPRTIALLDLAKHPLEPRFVGLDPATGLATGAPGL